MTSARDRHAAIVATLELITRCAGGTTGIPNAVRMWQAADADQANTLRAASYEPSSKRSSDRADPGSIDGEAPTGAHDPTGDAGCNGTDTYGARQIAEMDRLMGVALAAWTRADIIRAKAFRALDDPPPASKPLVGCESCARDGGRWEPIDLRFPGGKLCRWCKDVQTTYGRRPTVELVSRHHTGKRISDTEYRRVLGVGEVTG